MAEIVDQVTSEKELINSRGFISLISSAFSFSLMSVCIKYLDNRIPVSEIVFLRSIISIIITRFMLKKANINPWGNNTKLLLIRGLFGTIALFCVFHAIGNIPLAKATIIQFTYPTFIALAAWIYLGEGIGKRVIGAVAIGWVGVTFVVAKDSENLLINSYSDPIILVALSGALFTALAYITVRKLSKYEHPLVIVHYFPLVSIPCTLPFIIKQAVIPIGMDWTLIIGIGILTQLGQVWLTHGLALLPATQASSINYSQVLFASLWGIILFKEKIGLSTLIGALLVMVATVLSYSSISIKQPKQKKLPRNEDTSINI